MIRAAGKMIAAFGAIAVIAWSVFSIVSLVAADQQSAADRAGLRSELRAEKAARQALTKQVESLGEVPVVTTDEIAQPEIRYVPVPGRAGSDGSNGADGRDGNDGPPGASLPGKDGQSIKGADGTNGKDGADGKNGVDGAPGKDGTNGTNGADGRGITSLSCTGLFAPITFTVTYTDGTTAEFSCGTTPDPAPAD